MKKKGIKVDELYAYITKFMTPEEALKKLLVSSLVNYDKLKFASPEESIHPEILIAFASFDLGWNIAVEKSVADKPDNEIQVRGLCIGTQEYLDSIFPQNSNSDEEKRD
jgi:hypothetical protein